MTKRAWYPLAFTAIGIAAAIVLPAMPQPTEYHDFANRRALFRIAKVLEALDKELLAIGQMVSGHTLKHVAAALAGLLVLRMLSLRRPNGPSRTGP